MELNFNKKVIILQVIYQYLALTIFCAKCDAQSRFSLNQCIEYAYKQNFDVKLKELRLKQSVNTLEQSEKAIYPNLSGSFSQGINSGRSIDPFTNGFIQRTISSNSFGANANFTIFNGFSLKNQIIQNQLFLWVQDLVQHIRVQQRKNMIILIN